MGDNYVKCVKIIHHPEEVRLYRILSAFFRFIGVFACENLAGDEYGDDVDWICNIEKGSEKEGVSLDEKAESILSEMRERFGKDCFIAIQQIWNVFKHNELMRGSYAIDYFSDSGSKFIYQQMETAIVNFREAFQQLEKVDAEYNSERCSSGNVYIWMAKASCQRRMNELSKILENAVNKNQYIVGDKKRDYLKNLSKEYVTFDKINENISKVLDVAPQFYAAYAIRGFVKDISVDYKLKSVEDLREAIKIIGTEKSYTSYLWFRIGRFYEQILSDGKEKAMHCYEKAISVDQHNFRALYRLAQYEYEQHNFDAALHLWSNLLDVLRDKKGSPSLQPVECAYLYKTYQKLGDLFDKAKNYLKEIEYLQHAEEIYLSTENENLQNGFYPWMFRTETISDCGKKSYEIYKEAARKKLRIKKLYAKIMNASSRQGAQDIHAEYMRRYYKEDL